MSYVCCVQPRKTTQSAKDVQDSLAAEWESFEKLIQGGSNEQAKPAAVSARSSEPARGGHASDPPVVSARSSVPARGGHATDQPVVTARSSVPARGGHASDHPVVGQVSVRQKRVFRETESDSDANTDSDSEDELHPVLPGTGMKSGSNYDVAWRSSSSDSSQSAENNLQTKPTLSDSESSSDDEKPQTALHIGKCEMFVVCVQIQMGICRARLTNCPGALTNVRSVEHDE